MTTLKSIFSYGDIMIDKLDTVQDSELELQKKNFFALIFKIHFSRQGIEHFKQY